MTDMSMKDKIRGSLIGGAIGDALGYPIRDLDLDNIHRIYSAGITDTEKSFLSGEALISDVTQLSMFTACGVIYARANFNFRGHSGSIKTYVRAAYHDWVLKQLNKSSSYPISWIVKKDELGADRGTDANFIVSLIAGLVEENNEPINDSKNSGGIGHLAPLPLAHLDYKTEEKLRQLDNEAVEIVKLTYGHPLAYIPAITLNHIIHDAALSDRKSNDLESIVNKAMKSTEAIYGGDSNWNGYKALLNRAIACVSNGRSDVENICSLGQGWDADTALAIAIYCSLKYSDDYSKGIVAAVNHSGDSSSTGSITGNILGAWLGYDAIEEKWKENLELNDTILELSDDIAYVCHNNGYYKDDSWRYKYDISL